MEKLSAFCTCTNFSCPLHPSRHDKGCAPCISKNLRLREIPTCFFNTVEKAQSRSGDSYEDFASLILRQPQPSK